MNPLEESERIALGQIDEVLKYQADREQIMIILRRVALEGMDSTLNALTQHPELPASKRPVL